MRKPTPEKQKELNLKSELEKLVESDIQNLKVLTNEAKAIIPVRYANSMNYEEVKAETDSKANNIVDSIAEFYLNKNIIEEIPYVKQKNIVDKLTVSNLLFQMKTAEHAITKLLEEIDNGNLHPRTFEVLASLQKSKMEIVKHLAQFMVIMENNYKSLREDYRVKNSEEPLQITAGITEEVGEEEKEEQVNKFQMRGSRQLIEALRQVVPEQKNINKSTENLTDTDNARKDLEY
jgi:hypothetical protein